MLCSFKAPWQRDNKSNLNDLAREEADPDEQPVPGSTKYTRADMQKVGVPANSDAMWKILAFNEEIAYLSRHAAIDPFPPPFHAHTCAPDLSPSHHAVSETLDAKTIKPMFVEHRADLESFVLTPPLKYKNMDQAVALLSRHLEHLYSAHKMWHNDRLVPYRFRAYPRLNPDQQKQWKVYLELDDEVRDAAAHATTPLAR